MSGSEDGQLRSPGEEQLILSGDDEDEHDTDSLDIKPPQANVVSYSRDSSGSRRKDRSSTAKEKKHSKERRHNRDAHHYGGHTSERDRDLLGTERSRDHHDHRRDNMERYHQRSASSGAYDDTREMLMSGDDRRFPKHYERNADTVSSGGSRGGGYHYHHQATQQSYHHQLHMQRTTRHDYYIEQRGQSYNHGGGGGTADYHGGRHQSYGGDKHSAPGGGGHAVLDYHGMQDENYELQRDHRKYRYEHVKDAESLEQDLRSRLLSKRHKYVKSNGDEEDDDDERDVHGVGNNDYHVNMLKRRDYADRERKSNLAAIGTAPKPVEKPTERVPRERERVSVIEVLDSPEGALPPEPPSQMKRKHKRHHKEKSTETKAKRRVTPDDPELLARREKILAAEREKERRMEIAHEELAARRERRREHKEQLVDTLSPTAVAASVTAGLNVLVKRKKADAEHDDRSRRKRTKRLDREESHDEEDDDDDDDEPPVGEEDDDSDSDEEDDDDDDDSDSSSDSAAAISDPSYVKCAAKASKNKTAADSNDEIELPASPLSIGELSKSPPKISVSSATGSRKKKSKKKHKSQHYNNVEVAVYGHPGRSSRSQTRSRSRSLLHSRSPHSRSSRSHSAATSSHSRSPHSTALSRSRSRSLRSDDSAALSRSRSRSRTRSEERDMHAHKKREEEIEAAVAAKAAAESNAQQENNNSSKTPNNGDVETPAPICDEKGVPLPNYYPGVQGCRSVEEFQCLNRIEEGTYGVVYRAKDKRTSEIVALKRLKMEKEREGFPITSLREINTLLKGQHPNIVTVREIVVGSNLDKIYIVMDYVEHDLKSLMETMKTRKQSFFPAEVKCLTQQLLRAVGHLHDNWILHRDLKTSNLLLSHKGILKVGDFGLAREYGSPLKKYTSLVVTLWYRAPELLLCSAEYSTPIDIWSVGCIFAEFLQMAPLFPGKTEIDELNRIFKDLGTPNEKIWPGYQELPAVKNMLSQNSQFAEYPVSNLRKRFSDKTSDAGISLLQGLLTYDPKQRLNADAALKHSYFKELPPPIDPSMFPTWPAKSELGARKALASSPKPPSGGSQFKQLGRDDIMVAAGGGAAAKIVSGIITGNKKTTANTGFVLRGIDQRQLANGPGFSLKF